MKTPPVKRSLVLVVAVGLCAIAGWMIFGHSARDAAQGAAIAAATPAEAESTEAADDPEIIRFPREQWDAAGLHIEEVHQGPMTESVELTGKIALNEDRLAHIYPLVEGRVEEVLVGFGERVRQGDTLVVVQSQEVGQQMLQLFQDRMKLGFAEIKDRWIQDVGRNTQAMIAAMKDGAAVEQLERDFKDRPLGDSRERLMGAYVELLKWKAHLERLAPLSERGAVSGRQVMEAGAEVDAARAKLNALWEQIAQDAVQASRLSSQTLKELRTSISVAETSLKILGFEDADLKDIDPAVKGEALAHYPVRAPFDGTVISKDVALLERVAPDRQILTIADLSTVWVTADIYEIHLPLLARLSDQTLRFRCEAWPEREFEARIFYTGDVVQESTRTIALRAAAANPDGLLKPGMFVTVTLPGPVRPDVVQVPATAVMDHQGWSFVFLHAGADEFRRQDVVVGQRAANAVEIRSGLQSGDRVVTEGGFALKSRMLAELLAE